MFDVCYTYIIGIYNIIKYIFLALFVFLDVHIVLKFIAHPDEFFVAHIHWCIICLRTS